MTMQFIMYVRKNELKHMRNAQLGLRSVSCTAEDQVEFSDFTSYVHNYGNFIGKAKQFLACVKSVGCVKSMLASATSCSSMSTKLKNI